MIRDLINKALDELRVRNLDTIELKDGQKRTIEEVEKELAMHEWR